MLEQVPSRVLPALTVVECVARACYRRVANNTDVMATLSAFADVSTKAKIVSAADINHWSLVQRILFRESFDSEDPFYRQWLYDMLMVRAAAFGHLGAIQFLTESFPGCYVSLAVEEAASRGYLDILKWLCKHHNRVMWRASELSAAMRGNHLEVAQWLFTNVPPSKWCGVSKHAAAESGNLAILQWALAVDPPREKPSLLREARWERNLELLRWIIENGYYDPDMLIDISYRSASEAGSLDILQWVHQEQIGELPLACARFAGCCGHFETVRWLLEVANVSRDGGLLDCIADFGEWEIVEWLAINFPSLISRSSMKYAAEQGNLDAVKLLHGCANLQGECTEDAMNGAAEFGHLDVVKWLHENRVEGCTTKAMDSAASNGHLGVVEWLHENRDEGCSVAAMDGAARNGHLDVVKWLHENRREGCTSDAMDGAAEKHHLEVLRWLHANRVEGCTTKAMDLAAGRGHLDVLQWLKENQSVGCTPDAMLNAARGGHLAVLKWIHAHWEVRTPVGVLYAAAAGGHIAMIHWLVATRNVLVSSDAMEGAVSGGHLAAMIVLRSLECGRDKRVFSRAIKRGHLAIFQWLVHHYPDQVTYCQIKSMATDASPYVRKWLYGSGLLLWLNGYTDAPPALWLAHWE